MGILSESKPVLAVLLFAAAPFVLAGSLAGLHSQVSTTETEASAPLETSATFEQLPCQDFDGVIKVTLAAADNAPEPVDFVVMEDGSSYGEAGDEQPYITVAPGATRELVISGLPDGPRTIEVLLDDTSVVPPQEYVVECDDIPTEPYDNAKARVIDACSATAYVFASNKPIRGVVDLLEPVEFVVTATPAVGEPSELARLVLPAEGEATPYEKEFTHQFDLSDGLVQVTVTANGDVIASSEINPTCEVVEEPVLDDEDCSGDSHGRLAKHQECTEDEPVDLPYPSTGF